MEWCGFQNMGNSCYMNAGLQCICSLPKFAAYFLGKSLYARLFAVATCLLISKETWQPLAVQCNKTVISKRMRIKLKQK